MYAYGVRCDTLGHWEFERSTRHCIEFKITNDKIVRWNKMLLFWIKLRKYTHIAWFLLSIWPISSFWGGFRCLSQLSIDKFKAGYYCFETPGTRGSFLMKSEFAAWFFPLMKEAQFIGPLLRSAWKIFELSTPIWTIFASLLELSTFRCSLWPSSRLRHSLESTLALLCDKCDLPDRCTVKNFC